MNWKTIRLELATAPGFPSGSVSRGYLIRVPLHGDGSIDPGALARTPQRATVRRFWSTDPDESGRVAHAGDRLTLEFNGTRMLAVRPPQFQVGDAVSLIDSSGSGLPFRIASIREVARADHRL